MAGASESPVVESTTDSVGTIRKKQAVDRVLSSRHFTKAPLLSSFLSYICKRILEDGAARISEHEIGVNVFNRAVGFDPREDNIVRTYARQLRQRLETYYASDGQDATLRICIPRGGYIPVFQNTDQAPVPSDYFSAEAGQPQSSDPASSCPAVGAISHTPTARLPSRLLILGVLLGLLVSGDILLRLELPSYSAAPQHAIWSAVFNKNRPTVIVASDDALVLFQELTHSPVSLDDYISETYLEKAFSPKEGMPLSASWLNSHQYTSMADLNMANRITQVPEAQTGHIDLRFARNLQMDELRNKNVILIGGIGANPWVSLFSNQLNFSINYDWKSSRGYVSNKSPKKGEPALFEEIGTDGIHHNYGVLAYLPGLEDDNEVLLFEGTGMAGTEAAAAFLFSEDSFARFSRQIGATSGRMPHFEVLLETSDVGGNAPNAKMIAYRIVNP